MLSPRDTYFSCISSEVAMSSPTIFLKSRTLGEPKKLRKLDNVSSLEIQVSEGRAVLNPEPGTSLDLAAIEQAVRDGGFTPRVMTLTARGRLSQRHGTPALELTDGTVLLFAEGGQTDELLMLTTGSAVRVEGQAALAARGESPSAFDGRCLPPRDVTRRSNTPGILSPRALRGGRLAGLGATRDFHHGLLEQGDDHTAHRYTLTVNSFEAS